MDLKAIAKEKLSLSSVQGDSRARVIGGSAAGLAIVLVVLLLTLTTCGGGSGAEGNGKKPVGAEEDADKPSEAVVRISPGDDAKDVAPTGKLEVTAEKGKLTKVAVEDADGRPVDGKITEGGAAWRPAAHLSTGTRYSVRASAQDAEGRTATKKASFTTLKPKNPLLGRFTPEDGDKVGAGMPVSIEFNRPVEDRAAVEKAISVTADPKVRVEGHWFGDQRLDFRPEDYWAKGTDVTLDLGLDGVEGAKGVYGTQDKKVRFAVARHQVSVVDAKTKKMTVTRDGKKIKTIPITSGSPEHPTYNGRMVISERLTETRMDGNTVGFGRDEGAGGYDIKDVPHAQRLSTSGTFIHGNYWNPQSTFGRANVSHGCVGLYDLRGGGSTKTPGAWFFRNSIVGDVVEIKNSHDKTVQPDNGLNGWNMSWEKWTAKQ
ncbi:Ig-like domain-containing protein [Streptomyces sp. ODS28]|uniref:L,D-transpeptidase n=1 Tax=Streptomyces sp. ODS28 TaxID=3136688 RepID=UPI0031E702D3